MTNKDYICASTNTHSFCCGVEEIGNFRLEEEEDNYWGNTEENDCSALKNVIRDLPNEATAFYTATFIHDEECRAAYEMLKDKMNLIYQSPVRVNPGTGNKLFICIYTAKGKK